MVAAPKSDPEQELIDEIARFTHDPLGFVLFAFPWGEPGTPLANETGPDDWQRDILEQLGAGLIDISEAIRIAVASGHGIGKSALVAWLVLWAISTFEDTRGVVTANTEAQLRTKTWAELAKWHRLCITKDWFTLTATAIASVDLAHARTWRIDAIPWSETNLEAFAGLHNAGKRVILIFDEGSAIADGVWEVAEGALTDEGTELIWCAFGNPTKNTGRFRECFGRYRHRWTTRQIDSRTAKKTNKAQLQQWVDDYGEDSDFVRVRVRGVFPRAGSMQFVPGDRVEASRKRTIEPVFDDPSPVVIGVDVARFGDDETVIAIRKGRDAKSIPWIYLREVDTMTVASRVAEAYMQHKARMVFVDEGGVGAGVMDRLRQLQVKCTGVNFGGKPYGLKFSDEHVLVRNRAAEMWAAMRDWLHHGAIPDDVTLETQLTSREYGFDPNNAIVLERKEDMKKRGLESPDRADALGLTFAAPVLPASMQRRPRYDTDYRVFD